MSKVNSARTNNQQVKPPSNDKLLEIKHPYPGEEFFFTGNAEHRCCVVIEEVFRGVIVTAHQYYPVAESALSDISTLTEPVLFHQAVSESGEMFVIPQRLNNIHSDTCAHANIFWKPPSHWLFMVICDDCEGLMWEVGPIAEEDCFLRQDYAQQLDAALMPRAIESTENPIVTRLNSMFNELNDMGGLEEFDDSGAEDNLILEMGTFA